MVKRRRVPGRKANIPERPCERAVQAEPERCLHREMFFSRIGKEMPGQARHDKLMNREDFSAVGFLRAGPLGEGVRGRREKMADQVRHDEAAEARGRLPPLEDPSALAYFFRFSAVWGGFTIV